MTPHVVNALTIDVEDWAQSVLDPELPPTNRFHANTLRVLELLDRHRVRATFFVLGLVAEKRPDLVRTIQTAGHEIASHGYGHRLATRQTPSAFRADVQRSKKLLEDMTGAPVLGYRAPAFSVVRETLWALDILVECGFVYDSSIFPIRMRRYGMDATPWHPHRMRTPRGADIVEVPVASARAWGRRWPVAGGGYLRLLPAGVIQWGVNQLNRANVPATLYLHPYEFAPAEIRELNRDPSFPQRIPWRMGLLQGLGRRRVPPKLDRLLTGAAFAPVIDMLERYGLPPRIWSARAAPKNDVLAPKAAEPSTSESPRLASGPRAAV